MANVGLGEKNVDLLLIQYRAERKRLMFQLEVVRRTIGELEALRTKAVETVAEPKQKRGPGRPRKQVSEGEHKPLRTRKKGRKRGRRKGSKTGGYRLTDWDQLVLDTIKKNGLLPKETILEHAHTWAMTNAKKMPPDEIAVKITRSLQKLSGTRGMLGKHRTGLRRGYHYGLKDWFFASTGALRRQHLDKLVIAPKD
ncbi:MAG: hypothetical protein IT225_01270 [Flavobacteriales bacterium]|nr:hypothetical protein [Flavobacteriales bacterium]